MAVKRKSWKALATGYLTAEIAHQGMRYADLVKKLAIKAMHRGDK